jgi:hypothetical protein
LSLLGTDGSSVAILHAKLHKIIGKPKTLPIYFAELLPISEILCTFAIQKGKHKTYKRCIELKHVVSFVSPMPAAR